MQPGGGSRDGGAWPAPRPGGVYRGLRQHLGAALAAGTMRGRSSLTFVFLSLAVTWAVAQHAPPVGELAQRARRGGGGAGAGVAGRAGRYEHLVLVASLQVCVVSCVRGFTPLAELTRHSWNRLGKS